VSDGIATVGITDHAQAELTDVVFVELPEVGKVLNAGDAIAVVESVKTAGDIYAPVMGEVVEVNAALTDEPGLVNTAPYGDGWFYRLKPLKPEELDGLLSAEAYRAQIGG
jgi:glycine cleavage system H protein